MILSVSNCMRENNDLKRKFVVIMLEKWYNKKDCKDSESKAEKGS